jgi:TPR repeat protein
MRYDKGKTFEGEAEMKKFLWALVIISGCFAEENDDALSTSMKAMQKACQRHVATACYEFGILYEEGIGVKKDIEKAKAYYKQACEDGYEKACRSGQKVQADI